MASRNIQLLLVRGSRPTVGGGNTYEDALVELVEGWASERNVSVDVLSMAPERSESKERSYSVTRLDSFYASSSPLALIPRTLSAWGLIPFRRKIARMKADLVWFLSPNLMTLVISKVPFIATVWDHGHRDAAELPEYSQVEEWAMREKVIREGAARAFRIFTESEVTRSRLLEEYGISRQKTVSLGMAIAVREVKQSAEKIDSVFSGRPFFYVPAQFWPHKNHITFLRAFKILREKCPNVVAVFTGSDKGNESFIRRASREIGVAEAVFFLGYVSQEQVDALSSEAVAVCLPTLIGPTNIPPLEALRRGTVAIVSDVHRFDEEPIPGLIKVPVFSAIEWAQAMEEALDWRKPIEFSPTRESVEIILDSVFSDFTSRSSLHEDFR